MSNNAPGSNKYDQLFPPIDLITINPRSPPKTKRTARKSTEIKRTPDRNNESTTNNNTKNVTPATAEHSNSRENKKLCGFKGMVRMINPGSIWKTLWR